LYDFACSTSLDKSLLPLLIRTISKLSKDSGEVPPCLSLEGVQVISQHPVDGGGLGDVWKGQIEQHAIAVKTMRLPSYVVDAACKVLTASQPSELG
jgi:predicted nuclease with RNAse H fold